MEQHLNLFLALLAHEKGYSANTILAYTNDLTKFIDFLRSQNINGARKVDADTIRAYLESQQVKRRYTPSTIARKIAAVRSFFIYLKSQGVVIDDPTETIQSPKVPRQMPQVLSEDEVARLLDAPSQSTGPKALRDHALLELLYATGMRVSELVRLQVSDINLDTEEVYCKGKKKSARIIPINNERVLAALEDYLDRGRPHLTRGSYEDALFLNHRGRKLSRQGLWLIIKMYADLAGISGSVTPHVLRHSFAHHALGTGEDIRRVQVLLGHANLASTQIYSELDKHQTLPTAE